MAQVLTTTARDLVIDAIDESGALGVGQSPLPEDLNKIFNRFRRMVQVWQQKRWLQPSLQEIVFTADGSKSYTMGIGGDINIKRPNDIKSGWVVQLNTGSNAVSLPMRKIFSYEDYGRISVKDLFSLPDHFWYDAQYPIANLFPWPIPNSTYELHFLIQSGLNFGSTISLGSIFAGGAGYITANYPNVALTGGSGTGATGDFTVTAGVVAIVNLDTGGKNYQIGDILGVDPADLGGAGAGFAYKVVNIAPNIDSEIIMPEEYEEPLMYNLALRACSFYQVTPIPTTERLAKAGLASIRAQNTQVPSLTMPSYPGLRRGKAFNLFNADGY